MLTDYTSIRNKLLVVLPKQLPLKEVALVIVIIDLPMYVIITDVVETYNQAVYATLQHSKACVT